MLYEDVSFVLFSISSIFSFAKIEDIVIIIAFSNEVNKKALLKLVDLKLLKNYFLANFFFCFNLLYFFTNVCLVLPLKIPCFVNHSIEHSEFGFSEYKDL